MAAVLPLILEKVSTALKAMFCLIVLILRKTTTIAERHVKIFVTGEMLTSSCLNRNVTLHHKRW